MGKENIQKQIEIAKQELFNEKLRAERENQRNMSLSEENKKRREIEQYQEYLKKRDITKKFFAGTNIIETLEEIQKEYILNNNVTFDVSKKIFLGRDKRYLEEKIIPMDIDFNSNSIKVVFDNSSYGPMGNDRDYDPIYRKITISKKDNDFEFSFKNTDRSKDFEILSSNPAEIIKGIFKVVALKQTGELK